MIKDHKLVEATFKPSPNVGGALRNPKFLVIHFTAGRSAASAASWLCQKVARASAQLVIGRGGELFQLVPFDRVAWHAGQSKWKGYNGLNSFSIGLELDNPGPLIRSAGGWRSPHLGINYPDADVLELRHQHGGPLRGWLKYSEVQIAMVEKIGQELRIAYPTIEDVIGHDDIAPNRKQDPGPQAPMVEWRSRIFG